MSIVVFLLNYVQRASCDVMLPCNHRDGCSGEALSSPVLPSPKPNRACDLECVGKNIAT